MYYRGGHHQAPLCHLSLTHETPGCSKFAHVQNQKAVSAYLKSNQLLPSESAHYHTHTIIMICFNMTCTIIKYTYVLDTVEPHKQIRGPPFYFQGRGGWSFLKINNFGRTLREINNLLQELFYINMQ